MKMRVWDKEAEIWIDHADFTMYLDGSFCVDKPWGCYEANDDKKFIVEYSTGFKDDNGIEIYYGDLLKLTSYKINKDIRLVDEELIADLIHYGWDCKAEVIIGNIHENKKLI